MSANISPSSPQSSQAEDIRTREADALLVGGITGFSATDYPGRISSVVFVQGCPWHCRYCHNEHLQRRIEQPNAMRWSYVRDLLKRRVGLVDAVVFSGGEPTVDPALEAAIDETRMLGFGIGLHSCGAYPERLRSILPHLDWIGFDIKADFDAYGHVTGVRRSGVPARASAELVLASGIEHEFRTTIHPGLLSEDDILYLAKSLSNMGVKNYALQVFRPDGCSDEWLRTANMMNYPSDRLLERVRQLFPQFTLRDTRMEG